MKKGLKKILYHLCLGMVTAAALLYNAPSLSVKAAAMAPVPFFYTGGPVQYIVPVTGYYKLEVWGAEGSNNCTMNCSSPVHKDGLGGYATGIVHLTAGQSLWVVVGGSDNGYNGGGGSYNHGAYSYGGGATHIGTFASTLAAHGSADGVYIVAGGGGSRGCTDNFDSENLTGGAGGGFNGTAALNSYGGQGGTQTVGGAGGVGDGGTGQAGSFGQGGIGAGFAGNGGGGFFGGGGGGVSECEDDEGEDYNCGAGGGGGSSYLGSLEQSYTVSGVWSGNGKAVITPLDNTLVCEYPANFNWVCPSTGNYSLETWGAQGGNGEIACDEAVGIGGNGGYAYGEVYLTAGTVLQISVGTRGVTRTEGQAQDGHIKTASGDPGTATLVTAVTGALYLKGDGGGGGSDWCRAYDIGGGDEATNGSPGSFYVNTALMSKGTGAAGVRSGHGMIRIAKLASEPAGGGSNYVNTGLSISTSGAYGSNSDIREGNGVIEIRAVSIGFQDHADLLGAYTPDTEPPGSVGNLRATFSNGSTVLTWSRPQSNGTKYDFRVKLFQRNLASATGVSHISTSDIITKSIESAVAGYYYVCDNSPSSDVAGYVNLKYAKPAYTWSNQHYSDSITGFVQSEVLVTNTSCSYVHVAAVDVAGNIGPTSHKEINRTNLCRITFDTNHLKYQINPQSSVDAGSYSATGKTGSLAATGKNKQNAFYRGYYAVCGTNVANNSKGTFDGVNGGVSFGGEFPIPSATGCVFLGWNSKADGTGEYYSADGSNIGYSGFADGVLAMSSITGSEEAGQEITLYAIWAETAEGTTVTNVATSNIRKNYKKPLLNTATGVYSSNGILITEYEDIATSAHWDTTWTNSANVETYAQFTGAGLFALSQHLYTVEGNRIATTVQHTAGMASESIANYSLRSFVTNPADTRKPVWDRGFDAKTTVLTANGSSQLTPDSFYNTGKKTLHVDYNIQGSYKVFGSAISRSYIANNLTHLGQPGYPGHLVTNEIILKIDNTAPQIDRYSVAQDSLGNYTAEEVSEAIGNGLNTVFKVEVSDNNDASKGMFVKKEDSAGIQDVYIFISDANDRSCNKTFKMTLKEIKAYTEYDNHVLAGKYELDVNLYAEFSDASFLLYKIYIVDNAGNISEALDQYEIPGSNGETLPSGNVSDIEVNSDTEIMGVLQNYSVKTVVYSNENEAFNIDEGETYFQVGDFGHVEVWTVGYTESVSLDFGDMGQEAKREIEHERLSSKYNMGIEEDGWTRTISWEKSDEIIPSSFTVYDELSGMFVEITQISHPELFDSLLTNENGVYYAQHYSAEGWGNEGMSVRIPPYYQLTPDGNKKNKDGTPQYKWELWRYAATANKDGESATSTSEYIIWDTRANDVHFRVIHES